MTENESRYRLSSSGGSRWAVSMCSRCNGTGTIVYLIGDGDPRDAPIVIVLSQSFRRRY